MPTARTRQVLVVILTSYVCWWLRRIGGGSLQRRRRNAFFVIKFWFYHGYRLLWRTSLKILKNGWPVISKHRHSVVVHATTFLTDTNPLKSSTVLRAILERKKKNKPCGVNNDFQKRQQLLSPKPIRIRAICVHGNRLLWPTFLGGRSLVIGGHNRYTYLRGNIFSSLKRLNV